MARKTKTTAADTVRNIRRKSRKGNSGEEKIRVVLDGLRGKGMVAVCLIVTALIMPTAMAVFTQ